MAYPPTRQLTLEEKDQLWRYRFYLSREKKVPLRSVARPYDPCVAGALTLITALFCVACDRQALTKFLRAVMWDEPAEEKQALELLEQWAPIDMEDALELLSPAFTNPAVRAYAVSRLTTVDDEVRCECPPPHGHVCSNVTRLFVSIELRRSFQGTATVPPAAGAGAQV